MTTKQYRTAMGKTVDMGAIMLQNEQVRAVGNMAVNARGDRLDSTNRVIDRKGQQVNRQYKKQAVSQNIPTGTSNAAVRQAQADEEMVADPTDSFEDLPDDVNTDMPDESQDTGMELQGGLAAAIAKAKTVQQTKMTTPKQAAKAASGVRKL